MSRRRLFNPLVTAQTRLLEQLHFPLEGAQFRLKIGSLALLVIPLLRARAAMVSSSPIRDRFLPFLNEVRGWEEGIPKAKFIEWVEGFVEGVESNQATQLRGNFRAMGPQQPGPQVPNCLPDQKRKPALQAGFECDSMKLSGKWEIGLKSAWELDFQKTFYRVKQWFHAIKNFGEQNLML